MARLAQLDGLLDELDQVAAGGEAAYLADRRLRLMAERALQLAIQICIDVGAHLVSELAARPPTDYAGIFTSLADAGALDRELAGRLASAARQRNLLIHLYREIDDRKVFASLEHLDDLREFAALVRRLVTEPPAP